MPTKLDMIGVFVTDLPRMSVYRDALGFAIDWDGQGPYAEFKDAGVRFSMYERAQLPELLGQGQRLSQRAERHLRARHRPAPCWLMPTRPSLV